MIHKDCVNFKEIQSRIVYFPTCDLRSDKKKPYKCIITDYSCENCGDYKKAEERTVSEEEKV